MDRQKKQGTPDLQKEPEKQENMETPDHTDKNPFTSFTCEGKEISPGGDRVCETQASYGRRQRRQGEYTLEDYYALPDDQRVELIDGVFYDMAAPYTTHQIGCADIFMQLAGFIRSQKGTCRPLISPVDVQLDCDDRTMVQPDVLVVCDRDKIKKRCVYGAPDLVIEILSDSTARKDTTVKLKKYLRAGVREYWIVDLQQEVVVVHDMSGENCRTSIYGMNQPIPVRIFEGKCQIRFDEICEEVRPLLSQS
ncbi:MAG: Uma2 family endonuclease [Lachnospiraceae bacterium]|nr:Uma2 family endonuclease [Lachnospiraceae bacterium]